jgi:3-hydroxyisobutyrate dehydrogenase-like beta-hydroxyacid dehydrogenase
MTTVGMVSPGFMGAGLGWALIEGGARVVATVEGRSARTRRLAEQAGLELLPTLADVLTAADVVLSVTPPGQALTAARRIAATARECGATPLVADLNAISPATMAAVADALTGPAATSTMPATSEPAAASSGPASSGPAATNPPIKPAAADPLTGLTAADVPAGLAVVDGSISGAPPTVRPGANVYFSGPRAAELAALPWAGKIEPIVLGAEIGSASALKMCTASVYKGLNGLVTQAMRTAGRHGVLDRVIADLKSAGLDGSGGVAVAATKAHRYVDEMREISATQAAAGLPPALFEAFAQVYAEIAKTALAEGDPESTGGLTPAEVVARLGQ